MELTDKVVVVTGGASGIGRAMVSAFVAAGARGVVVADLDQQAAHEVVRGLESGRAINLHCDVTSERSVIELIDATDHAFGDVDVFVANAGVASGEGLAATDQQWRRVLDVNLWAHIYAARKLVPRWASRGEGYFVSTASAAGLLTQIGDAPYSVSKHAAVAFAEWLAVTYGARGVRVSCLCPMGVDTPLLRQGLGSTGGDDLATRVVTSAGAVLSPDLVASLVVEALAEERFLILPHPETAEFLRRKTDDHDRWIRGMQRLHADAQRNLNAPGEEV